ncbi:MAG: kelch repeat-containing protein, partial [Candidatus Lutacidiplasmatales archaeon]
MRGALSGHAPERRVPPKSRDRVAIAVHFGVWIVIALVGISWSGPMDGSAAAPVASPLLLPEAGLAAADPLTTGSWSTLSEPVAPPPRGEGTFTWATFGGKQVGVLFGGRGNFSALDNDTWLFQNGSWHPLNLPVHPTARRGAMAAFDPVDGYVVLFGGSSLNAYENDTWVFNGTAWSQLTPAHPPPARRVGGFAFDAADGYLLLFSGHNGTSLGVNANFTTIDDTWKFLHGRWTELFPSVQPLGRSEPSEIYDPAVGSIVVFGGYTTQPSYLAYNDLWTFRAGTWTPVSLTTAPSPRDGAPMAFDPAVGAAVLEGGQNESGNLSTLELNDTWVLEGTSVANLSWDPVTVATRLLPADSGAMVFDPDLGTVVVFGGHSGDHGVVWYNSTAAFVFPYSVNGTANPTPGGSPLSFNFTSSTFGGLGPFSYHWNFGDSAISMHANPLHVYAKRGNYTVWLNTTDSLGSRAMAEFNLTAYRRLVATLNESAATIKNGSSVDLTVSTRGG